MATYLVFGGSSGLGLEVVKNLSQKGHDAISISRRKLDANDKHISLDLSSATDSEIRSILKRFSFISGICFSQRYREPNLTHNCNSSGIEFRVMVESISKVIKAFEETNVGNKDQNKFTRMVIVGSTYTSSVGYDQSWCYHACKSAQIGLMRFYSLNRQSRYNINMISPATFIKEGAEEYWLNHENSKIWNKYPNNKLISRELVSREIVNLCLIDI